MSPAQAKFRIGQLIRHRLFDYRGVIVDVDPRCMASEEWYEAMARTRPPKDRPWYHVLVDKATHRTYVAERNIAGDDCGQPIDHPEIPTHFSGFQDGRYMPLRPAN